MICDRRLIILFILICVNSTYAYASSDTANEEIPLFAGTLLAIYAKNPQAGHSAIQPYVFLNNQYGLYNNKSKIIKQESIHRDQLFFAFQTGITDSFAIGIFPSILYAHSKNEQFYLYGDTIVFISFQLLNDQKKSWVPDVRILIEESLPTGKYKNLKSPLRIDASGSGTYETSFILITRKIFYNITPRPFNFNLNLYYIISSQTHVSGINVYGGMLETSGLISPGNQFLINLAFEYSLTHNWGCGIDLHFEHQDASDFISKYDVNNLENPPSWDRFSLAPCIEYNFSENLNIIGGMWFTVRGRNTPAFRSCGATLYYYF